LFKNFKKFKPPTIDGEFTKSKDAEAWLLGMRKFFRLHHYSENRKSKVVTIILKGKEIFGGNMLSVSKE